MKDMSTVPYHGMSEDIVKILCQRTHNNSPLFFRILTAYHLSKVAAMMHVKVHSKDRGVIPINMYAINLAGSGMGKGYSTNIIEEEVTNTFRTIFFDQTLPQVAEESLAKLANRRATIKGEDPDAEMELARREFEELGPMLFAFDSGTTPALKQARYKILMAGIGSMNFEMDECGSNLLGNAEVLSTMLELFDVGKVKQKLVKNSRENRRGEDIPGKTPTNLIMFGTPAKIFDGSKVEEEFFSFLEIGYARRCFFGYTKTTNKNLELTPQEIYDIQTDTAKNQMLKTISAHLGTLANPLNHKKVITVSKDVSLLLIEYRLHCERMASALGDYQEIQKAELAHRYFKVLKLAGVYAFVDGHSEVTEDNLYAAIKLAEESGEAFKKLLKRDKNYVKLAKYIAATGTELTHADLTEELPFYKGSAAQKAEILQLATAWGYRNRIIIKKVYSNNIEFVCGETLQPTDLNAIPFAVSNDITIGYKNMVQPFDILYRLATKNDLHWTVHHLHEGYRRDENVIPGFSLVVLDVDSGVSIDEVRILLKDYKCLLYTTKRHTPTAHRFRLIMPTNYFLKLDAEDYKEFMSNIYEWLPFPVDESTHDRARKWATFSGHYEYIDGENLIDVMEFIPKTTKNDERKKTNLSLQSLTNIERWFVNNTGSGNRSNQLIKYGLMLVDVGHDFNTIRDSVLGLNHKLSDKLSEREIDTTIMVSVAKALSSRTAATVNP